MYNGERGGVLGPANVCTYYMDCPNFLSDYYLQHSKIIKFLLSINQKLCPLFFVTKISVVTGRLNSVNR